MIINPKDNILMLVESPNKISTITNILKKNKLDNITVMASVGHITKIQDTGLYNMGIDPNDNFKTKYIISDDKKEIFTKLKAAVAKADKIILATDGDREGEAIAWHLKTFLKIAESKYERVVYHEITEKAILDGIKNSRKIDMKMVAAATARQKVDKILGYRLSPIARKNINCKSVGRCQSVGLKLVVDREKEIQSFVPEKYWELYLNFTDNDNVAYKAKYVGTDKTKINKFDDESDVNEIIKQCENNPYILKNIEFTEHKVNPKEPFTTSSYQQEVSSKLGIGVKQAMSYAQKLFEGIDVGNEHIALITYIRTDSVEYAPEFIDTLKTFIIDTYGKKYYQEHQYKNKKDNVQDAHEPIRCIDLRLTPEKLSSYISDYNLLKVYTIIYQRTVASMMSSCIISDTNYNIYNKDNKFLLSTHEVKFDGFRLVYNYDADEQVSPKVNLKEQDIISSTLLETTEKQTNPPKRFTEASFVKELEVKGIGRPSTYATILSTITDSGRGYCEVVNKNIIPTNKGIELSEFLDKFFNTIINIEYTAQMEKNLDDILSNKISDLEFLNKFYSELSETIDKVNPGVSNETGQICPNCGKQLVYRRGPYGIFLGCSGYPKCRYIKK